MQTPKSDFDAIVVGTGPGGATVAMDLSKQGQKVLILEWGDNDPQKGTFFSTLPRAFIPGKTLVMTKQAVPIVRAITTGGSSMIFCGTAFDPPVDMFKNYGVVSKRELESRYDTYVEQYCMTVGVEAALTTRIAKTLVFPAAIRYQNELSSTCANLKAVGYEFDTDTLDAVTELVKALQDRTSTLELARAEESDSTPEQEAAHCRDVILPAMLAVREVVDQLEQVIADDLWPLPTYQEMLFIR